MISVIAQERLLGAALGGILCGMVVYKQRKSIYRTISQHEPAAQFEVIERVPQRRSKITHLWNKAVDQTLGPVIASLSSRRLYSREGGHG